MSLTDIISGLDFTILTQLALVLFLLAFCSLMALLFRPGHRSIDAYAASLPLTDDRTNMD